MAQKTTKGQEGYYARYKSAGVQAKNRRRKLERQLKLQPNNEQVKQALLDIRYRRCTPKAHVWSHSAIRLAKIVKEFTGYFDMLALNSNSKVSGDALQRLPSIHKDFKQPKQVIDSIQNKAMFSIGARAKFKALN